MIKEQIEYRQQIAISLNYCGASVEAQLYIMSALYILADCTDMDPEVKKRTLQTLHGMMHRLRSSIIAPEPIAAQECGGASSRGGESGISTDVALLSDASGVVALLQKDFTKLPNVDKKVKKAIKKETDKWLVDNTLHADKSVTRFELAKKELLQVETYLFRNRVAGAACGLGSVVVCAGTVYADATITAMAGAALGGPIGLAVGIGLSVFATRSYLEAHKFNRIPEIRKKLNAIIMAADEAFEQNKFFELFSILSQEYASYEGSSLLLTREDRRALLKFNDKDKGKCIEIDENKILGELSDQKYRPDAVAYVLNMIAEGLMSRKLKFPNSELQTQNDLDNFAKNIFYLIINNERLSKEAEELDQKVYISKSSQTHWVTRIITDIFQSEVLLEADLRQAYNAPFSARLEEIRTVAKMNLIILTVLEDSDGGNAAALRNFNSLRAHLSGVHQYFTASSYRLAALEDFLAARNVIDRSKEEKPAWLQLPAASASVSFKYVLRWGQNDLPLSQITEVAPDSDVVHVFRCMLLKTVKQRGLLTIKHLIEGLDDLIDEDAEVTNNTDSTRVSLMSSARDLLSNFRALEHEEVAVAPSDIFLRSMHIKVFEKLFKCAFLLCQRGADCYRLVDTGAAPERSDTHFGYTLEGDRVASLFVVDIPVDADNANLAMLFENAQAALREAREDPVNAHLWWNVYLQTKKYLDANSTWTRFWVNAKKYIYNFNDLAYKSEDMKDKAVKQETLISFYAILESHVRMGKLDAGVDIAMKIAGDEFYAQSEYWYWRAVLFRKKLQYNEAFFSIHQALKKARDNAHITDLAVREKDLIVWLESSEVKLPIASYLERAYSYKLDYETAAPIASEATEFYDVLSIDGGGMRGLVPSFILAEVERRAGVPLHRLFHLHIGTSTGSLIAAALSLPRHADKRPYMAREVTQIYASATAAKIFEPTWHLYGLLAPKYSNSRIEVFKELLGPDTQMSESLNDLAVVAALHTPVSMRRFSKRSDPHLCVVDSLAASSAAPTYFSSHSIEDKAYVDGALVANNPGTEGHYEARECKQESQKIRVWSFGTGNLMSDPSVEDSGAKKNQSTLYWVSSAFKTSIDVQSRAVDDYMKAHAPNAFKRFQVWLDRPYAIDDMRQETLRALIENCRQFIHDHGADIDEMVNALLNNRGY